MNQADRCSVCGGELRLNDITGKCCSCREQTHSMPGDDSGPLGERDNAFAATVPHVPGFIPPTAEDLNPYFSQLEVLELLGYGGMGAVYKARQIKLDRLVALKIILPETAGHTTFRVRFHREARLLAKLNHPHIVGIYDFGEVSNFPVSGESADGPTWYYFAMEFVEGSNLRDLMRQPIPEGETLLIFHQVCEALQAAHEEGIVHRDIKPENILIDARGRVKIADFGLAKFTKWSSEERALTQTQQVMGTPRYMAPEQLQGSKFVDHRADIYALGVVVYEMLTGELPLGRFDPPSKKSHIDPRWDRVILKTLEQSPERRYRTVTEILTEIAPLSVNPAAGSMTQVARREQGSQLEALDFDPTQMLTSRHVVAPEIERRVKGPGIALMLNGLLGLLPAGALFISGLLGFRQFGPGSNSPAMGIVFLLLSLGMMGLVMVVVWGGWNLLTLGQYRLALLGSFLGQPAGIWGLMTLSRPEIRKAFEQQPRPLVFYRFVRSPLPWIVVMALFGIALTFQPWASMPQPVNSLRTAPLNFDGLIPPPEYVRAAGIGWWQGIAVCFGFGGILLIALFSAGMHPVPYSRPFALALFGAGIFALTGHFVTQLRSGSLPVQPLMEAAQWSMTIQGQRPVTIHDAHLVVSVGSAPELIFILTTGIFVLIAADLRRALQIRQVNP